MIKADVAGTYLQNTSVHLEYSANDFYANSYSNNCINICRGANFNNSNYDAYAMDINNSKLAFQLGTSMSNPLTRTEITTTYQQFLNVQLKIKNTNDTTNLKLSFDEPGYTFFSLYSLDPIQIIFDAYDSAVFENTVSVPLSPSPVINNNNNCNCRYQFNC
jgi:hypothetical protein